MMFLKFSSAVNLSVFFIFFKTKKALWEFAGRPVNPSRNEFLTRIAQILVE